MADELTPHGTSAPDIDIGIIGGTVIDPAKGTNEALDVAIRGDRIHSLGANLDPARCRRIIDATGLLVVPGLVDAHCHVYEGVSHYGINADHNCLRHGTTTLVDAGSAGADTIAGLRRYVIEPSQSRIFAHVNISTMGMISRQIGELDSLKWANADRTLAALADHADVTLGVKVRLTRRELVGVEAGLAPLHIAREAADRGGCMLMVHPQQSWAKSLDEVVDVLGAGDVLTHTYHGLDHSILDEDGRIRPAVLAARERGVIFDLGHGEASFSWSVSEAAIAQDFLPTMISTDLHHYNLHGPVHSLPHVMSKFLALGLPLQHVIEMATASPAKVIGQEDRLGSLAPGCEADVAILELLQQEIEYRDSYGDIRTGTERLRCRGVVKAGRVVNSPADTPPEEEGHGS